MANTYKSLSTVTVGAGGAASIAFNNIPQTYTDLVIRLSGRATNSSTTAVMWVFNSAVTVANAYKNIRFYGEGTSVGSDTFGVDYSLNNMMVRNDNTANTFGNGEIYIPNYTANNRRKASMSDGVGEGTATPSFLMMAGSYTTALTDPITSITLLPFNSLGNFSQYTTATLYGVFNADVSSAPATPTIGTTSQAAAGSSASVAFTGVSNAASYTATSSPGSFTGTGTTSPLTVSGLTDGTAYTFTVKSNNPFGSSSNSSASGSVTSTTFAAYWAGGNINGGSAQTQIQQFKFFAETRSNLSASLATATWYQQGLANSGVNGYFAGGQQNSGDTAGVQKLNFGTLTLSTTTALPAARMQSMMGYSNSGTAGYLPSGTVSGTVSNSIAKIAYSNDATSNISATMPTAVFRGSGCANSPTAGYTFGGTVSGSAQNMIQKMTFSSETMSTLGATLPTTQYTAVAASNNGTAAYNFGGYNGTMFTTIKKLTYSGETISTLSSQMSSQDFGADAHVGSWSGNAGYVGMGYNWVGSAGNLIGKLPYSNETWTTVSATMANSHLLDGGSCSNSGIL